MLKELAKMVGLPEDASEDDIKKAFAARQNVVIDVDPKDAAKLLFKAGQQPAAWLRSAEHLRDAAEIILKHELPAEISYSQAHKIAEEEAAAVSVHDGTGDAEIKAIAPNYPPAQLLYAYAIENVLKGLIVSKRPDLIQERKLDDELKNHDLNELAEKAEVTVDERDERPVLEALSKLSIWAGRYPVALNQRDFSPPDPNALLGWGKAHQIMRTFFERAYKELESRVPQQFPRFGKVLVCRWSPLGDRGGRFRGAQARARGSGRAAPWLQA